MTKTQNPLNILFLCSARSWGGNEKWTAMAASSLAARGHRVSVAVRNTDVGERMPVETMWLPFHAALDPATLFPLVRLARRRKIDVMIPTKRKDYVLAGAAARMCGAKSVMRLGIVRKLRGPLQHLVYARLTDGVIANAQPIKQQLLRTGWFQDDRIAVIRNGVDLARLDAVSPEPIPHFSVCSLGLLTPRKGFATLIEGFAAFTQAAGDKHATLTIAGEGDQRPQLEALAQKLGVGEQVKLPGFLPNPYPLLAASDVFALLSHNEGVANALLEAMYMRCACISSGAGGSAEVVEHQRNGPLLPTGDPQAVADALLSLYQDRDYRLALANAAHDTVRRECSLERMAKQIETFLHAVRGAR